MRTVYVRHVHTDLALHQLRDRSDGSRPLLLLHGLGERTPDQLPLVAGAWPGSVWGLDFTGHGASSVPSSGGYTAEVLMADVDHALSVLADDGPVTILGRGLGAYVGLLIAGARPELVGGTVLTDGPGLAGGGPNQHSPTITQTRIDPAAAPTPDPYALLELAMDVRPADYATTYARQAVEYSAIDRPISLATVAHHPWLDAVAELQGVVKERVGDALARFSV
jgi:pimeloyl-ACP methyl ester carboxylesterase